MKFFRKYWNNQRGYSVLELTISSAIGIIALAATAITFTNQQSFLKDENDGTKVRAKGRQAIKILAREIRMAGYGLPPGGAMTDISTLNSISFRTNETYDGREAKTHISGTSGIGSGDTVLNVVNGSDFLSGDNIVVYQTGYYRYQERVVDSGGTGTSIPLTTNFGENFNFAVNANLITVNKYNDWTITLVGDEIQKTIDGANTVVLIDDLAVAPGGLEFDFVGILEATTSKIGITLNMLDPDNLDASMEFKTDVTLRNLGIRG